METRLHLSVGVGEGQTQLLLRQGRQERLKAVLPPPCALPPNTCSQLLSALATWFNTPLHVAVFADVSGHFHALGLCNSYGVGEHTLHYRVQVVEPVGRPYLRLYGVGDFDKLRRATRGVGL